ncbi:MAG: alkaline phosphatase PafA [Chitinophagaceae bacterium]
MKTLLVLFCSISLQAQNIQRPKLVVGIVIDQMRWDYLYRYSERFAANGGFKRLLNQGFTCENTMIPYAPAVTAPGHASIYTGSVPAINGITGNLWWDNEQGREVYCAEDKTVKTVGSNSKLGEMSPRNLLVTTICDELRLATNFQSKVIGVALKDRGSILTTGHSANAAYWYDNTTGDWITSTYYMNDLPKWVNDLNSKKMVNKYYQQGWNTMFPLNTYKQSTADNVKWEGSLSGLKGFPYDTKGFVDKNFGSIMAMPQGNTLTVEMGKAAITGEQLGVDDITDFLAISFSSPDLIGHTFGPNSIEEEDNYLRLDKDLGDLLDFVDAKVGKGQWLAFLSADHAVAQTPGFLKEHKIPAGNVSLLDITKQINKSLKDQFGKDNLIVSSDNYQFYLNHYLIDSAHLNSEEIKEWVVGYLSAEPGIARVFALDKLMMTTLNSKQKNMLANGYYPRRSGDIQVILQPQYIDGFISSGTTHGLWNPYDTHIPLLWYGWGIKAGKTNREVYMTDIAPTIAAILHIQMPSGSIGSVIEEVMK